MAQIFMEQFLLVLCIFSRFFEQIDALLNKCKKELEMSHCLLRFFKFCHYTPINVALRRLRSQCSENIFETPNSETKSRGGGINFLHENPFLVKWSDGFPSESEGVSTDTPPPLVTFSKK